jgi:hypothetical protein
MPSQKFFGLAKEGWSLVALCEEGLSLIGRHIFEHGAIQPCESGTGGESPRARIHHETARQTRAFAEEVRDPETRRLLRALADRYDQMAVPVRRRPQFNIEK